LPTNAPPLRWRGACRGAAAQQPHQRVTSPLPSP
jgi:hypothetical protein